MNGLPIVSDRAAVSYDYFPTTWQAVVFRNWGMVPCARIAAVLGTCETQIRTAAAEMGLDGTLQENPEWIRRGYLTIIRENWHLLTFAQITELLDITEERLAFLLKEDDFLWHKMGQIKPLVIPAHYAALTPAQAEKTAALCAVVRHVQPEYVRDNAFDFVHGFNRTLTSAERQAAIRAVQPSDGLRTVYSYFALYGDPLLDETLNPFPEALLAEYAKMGVKGVWMQGILYQLIAFPFAPEMSEGHEIRMANLKKLIQAAARYDIGIYLYMNEPRAMPEAFFAKYPQLKGRREGDFYAMCTSCPEVQQYMTDGMYRLFHDAEGLAGFFTITMSENLTNCHSRYGDGVPCPRCAQRPPEEVVAEVNDLLARGAHRANPAAKAIAWNWGWGEDWAEKVAGLMREDVIVQCTSEERLPTNIGGIDGFVVDYTMSLVGPGEKAKRVWRSALAAGHEASAKVQFNNTWEMSAAPWLPVFDKVAGHVRNLKSAGVKHLQLSWTLGGYPSPNLKLASFLMADAGNVHDFCIQWLGDTLGEVAFEAQRMMSESFSAFPFHVSVLYTAPQNYAPMAPFFLERTDWKATMIGFPYDDLDSWRAIYPREVFERQFDQLVAGWTQGVRRMEAYAGQRESFDDMMRMAQAVLCHFASTHHHIAFVMARDEKNTEEMLRIVREERETVSQMLALRRVDARLGYEASNHYYYSTHDLLEKFINLQSIEAKLEGSVGAWA